MFLGQGEEGVVKRSALDMDPEVQAIMEMTGKTLHSQGLREPEEDQDEWGNPGIEDTLRKPSCQRRTPLSADIRFVFWLECGDV